MSGEQHRDESKQLISWSPSSLLPTSYVPLSEDAALNFRRTMSLSAYWCILLRRRWTVLVIAAVVTALVSVVSFLMTPVYEATAHLEIEPETPLLQSESTSDAYQKVDADDTFLLTQIQVIRSDNLAWQTIQQLNLADRLGGPSVSRARAERSENHKVELIGAFKARLRVEQVPRTRMLSVSFRDRDPKLAAQVATKLANNYLEYNFREKDEAIRRSGWMEQQLESLKEKVEQSQGALVNYEQLNQIVDSGDKENVLEQVLSEQSRDLTNAESERIQKEALYRQVTANPKELASLVHDDLLEKLEEKAADLKQQYTETAAQYGPNFPNAKRLRLQVNLSVNQIQAEQNRIIERIGSEYQAANSRENMVAAEVARQKTEVGRMNQLMVRDNTLRREFQTNQQLYESVLQSLKDATISAALRSTDIHLVDPALPPGTPVRPNKPLNITAALWVGLIIGAIVAFAQDSLDSSIKTPEEAESLMLSPTLGVIPFDSAPSRQSSRTGPPLGSNFAKTPNSRLSEAFRALGTALLVPSRPVKTLLVTSAQSSEGKTTIARNLAEVLAQRRGPVLLIDCDLRKRQLSRGAGQRALTGLTSVLSGELPLSDALIPLQPSLWTLPAGPVPDDSVPLLASQEMAALLKGVADSFEYVIIDSPPVLAATDAAVLSSLVDGVLLVTASGRTSRVGLVRARKILVTAGAKILGTTFNKLDPHHPDYSDSYSQYACG
jgi:polysaccharide biosynthesis transport protein